MSANPTLGALFDRKDDICGFCGTLELKPYRCGLCQGRYGEQGTISIDFPENVFVSRIEVYSGDGNGLGLVEDIGVYLSPSRLGGDLKPRTPLTMQVSGNDRSSLRLIPPSVQRISAIQLLLAEHDSPIIISEVVIIGSGVSNQGIYTSPVIDHGRPVVWGGSKWSIEQVAGSRVAVSARTGSGANNLRYWMYTGFGDKRIEVPLTTYESIRSTLRAGTTYNYDAWHAWPAQFDMGADTGSTPPLPADARRAYQMKLEFSSSGKESSVLRYFEIRASAPAVTSAVGELSPVQVNSGELTTFTYTFKSRLDAGDAGFDRLRISAVAAQIDSVLTVRVNDFEVPFALESLSSEQMVVSFPRVDADLTDALVDVRFRARALRYGAAFAAYLLDSDRPLDIPQPVAAGDATFDVPNDRVWIETSVLVASVLGAHVDPRVFSPNGDGINDETSIIYDIFEATGQVPVSIAIRDIAGRVVRSLHSASETIGHYERIWDGRDEAGNLVAPGIYLYNASTRIGGRDTGQTGVVRVVY
jgi:hypothetical protein